MSAAMKSDPGRVLILLCTYNEALNMPNMVTQLQAALPQADILVVDDNSPDGTGAWVQQAAAADSRLHLLARQGKLGLGSATRDGMRWCLGRNYDYLINLDADLSHRPADTSRLLAACQQPDCDVAVASRYQPGGGFANIAAHRRLMSWTLNRYANWLLKLPLTDCSGSFRCYRTSALRSIELGELSCAGYGFLEEILVALNRAGCRFVEVPIWFDARSLGHSKLSFADAWGAIKVIHQLRRGKR
jgi:dolichol-phosphate mannosyltransferase